VRIARACTLDAPGALHDIEMSTAEAGDVERLVGRLAFLDR
jgi:hypothetical protein